MWRSALVLCVLVGEAAATPPPMPDPPTYDDAVAAARDDLAACEQLGVDAGLYGDVQVKVARGAWSATASRSLGATGARVRACVVGAIRAQVKALRISVAEGESWHVIGAPRVVLPATATFLPAWRAARAAAGGPGARAARAAFAKLVPADYEVTRDLCLASERSYMFDAEMRWLDTAGAFVPRLWHDVLPKVLGAGNGAITMWTGAGDLLVHGPRGLCLVSVDASMQAALQAEMDKVGTCFVGSFEDILLRPRFEFPADRSYVQVAAYAGRACGLTSTGEVTCCGAAQPALPAAPTGLRSIALGHEFACGLDAGSHAVCWGAIAPPPTGTFTKISATHGHACGLRTDRTIACWGHEGNGAHVAPAGTFVDVAASTFSSCGVHTDGSIECWGDPGRVAHPGGRYTAVTATWIYGCGLRRDHSLRCWNTDPHVLWSPTAVAVARIGDGGLCGVDAGGAAACPGEVLVPHYAKDVAAPPPDLVQMAAAMQFACGVQRDHRIACWGDPWPGTWLRDGTFFYAHPGALVGGPPAPVDPGPASSVDLVPMCGRAPCKGPFTTQRSLYAWIEGTHVDALTPGTYVLDVFIDRWKKGEQRGTAIVEAGWTAQALTVKVAMKRTGTGKSIRGTLTLDGAAAGDRSVHAACSGDVGRSVQTAADGTFVLEDVGPPPCTVSTPNGAGQVKVVVDRLPATGVAVVDEALRAPAQWDR